MIILALYQCLIEAYYKKHNIEEKIMKKIRTLLLSGLAILSLGLVATGVVSSEKNVAAFAYSNASVETYYQTVGSKTGTELLSTLQSINSTALKNRVGYKSMPSYFAKTDPGASSGQVASFYSGNSAYYSGNMNREHVWPASRTVLGRNNDPLEDDIHMVRPTLISENSARGNSFFAEGGQGGDNSIPWDPANFNNPSYRGDAARIIFYCVVADAQLKLVDKDSESTGAHSMGKLSDLLKWNLQYPVADREKTRNNEAEKLQGNKNPFIDHPEYACRIWGNTNAATKQVCSGQVIPPDVPPELESLTLSETTLSLTVGQTHTLTLAKTPSDAKMPEVFWGSNNKAVATVNNGVVTAVGNGTATIRVTTADAKFILSCEVTVTGGYAPVNNHSGCGGNVATTSTIIATLSVLGIGMILLSRKTKKHE